MLSFGSVSDILGQEGVAYVRFIDFHLSVGRKKELVGLFLKLSHHLRRRMFGEIVDDAFKV